MPDEEDAIATLDTLKEELEGEVHFVDDETEGQTIVLVVAGETPEEPEYLSAGAIIRGKFVGKKVRVTIEELKP